jgi:hypothetical protein
LRSVPFEAVKEVTVRYDLSSTRTVSVPYYRRHYAMEVSAAYVDFAPFGSFGSNPDKGPKYLRSVIATSPDFDRWTRDVGGGMFETADKVHQNLTASQRGMQYAAASSGRILCASCMQQGTVKPGWKFCFDLQGCGAPLDEDAADGLIAVTSDPKTLEWVERLRGSSAPKQQAEQPHGSSAPKSAKVQKNREKVKFYAAVGQAERQHESLQKKARHQHWLNPFTQAQAEEKEFQPGPLPRQFVAMLSGLVADDMVADLSETQKQERPAQLLKRAQDIIEHGFESHQECYWNCARYRIRCDQTGGRGQCIGPDYVVWVTDSVHGYPSTLYRFDDIATDFRRKPFPQHLIDIVEYNKDPAAAKRQNPAKRTGSTAAIGTAKFYKKEAERIAANSDIAAVRMSVDALATAGTREPRQPQTPPPQPTEAKFPRYAEPEVAARLPASQQGATSSETVQPGTGWESSGWATSGWRDFTTEDPFWASWNRNVSASSGSASASAGSLAAAPKAAPKPKAPMPDKPGPRASWWERK